LRDGSARERFARLLQTTLIGKELECVHCATDLSIIELALLMPLDPIQRAPHVWIASGQLSERNLPIREPATSRCSASG